MDLQQWQQLANDYVPQVRICGGYWDNAFWEEDYRLSSVEWYVNRCWLRDHDDSGFQLPKDPNAQLQIADLLDNNRSRTYLTIRDITYRGGDMATAQVYAHARVCTMFDQGVDLQYWFFYPYNGSIGGVIAPLGFSGAHEGDWEHVTVRISDYADPKKRKIRGVFFAAHGSAEGAWMVDNRTVPPTGVTACSRVLLTPSFTPRITRMPAMRTVGCKCDAGTILRPPMTSPPAA